MIDLSVRGLKKAFEEDKNILEDLSFEVQAGERIGLLGKNGAGKTTLFRILVDEIEYDEGEVSIASGKRLGLISQIPHYPTGYTTEDVLKSAHARLYDLSDRLDELTQTMEEDGGNSLLREYDRLSAEFQRLGGYEMDVTRNKVANGLDIPQSMRDQLFESLSGGEKTRVNLARLILEDTEILLLDEPTNHLDMRATEWLEEYLLRFRGSVLIISHDRYFLDRVAQRTIEIVNGRAEFYSGNYSFYIVEKERRYQEQLIKYEKEQKEAKRLQESADRLYQWGTGNKKLMVKSQAIERRIERLVQTDRPGQERGLNLKFAEKDFRGDMVMEGENISVSFGDRTLFSDFKFEIKGGERIALIGDNGTGKSTLIKLIMDEMKPDTGYIRKGPQVKSAYLPQIIKFSDKNRSALDTLIYEDNCSPQTARNRLGAFKFRGEDVFRPVGSLSGGEQSRLRLCMLMKEEINFLILDEPTNHLDIMSREWIEEAVETFEETLLFVSHDRYFVDRFATRIWELENGRIIDYRGSFSQYREFKERHKSLQKADKNDAKVSHNKKKAKVSTEKLLIKTEKEIEKLEERIAELDSYAEEFSSDYQKLLEIAAEREEAMKELDDLYERWEELG